MKQMQGDLASLQRQIKDEVKKVVDGLERDARSRVEKEASLKKRIGEVKGDDHDRRAGRCAAEGPRRHAKSQARGTRARAEGL